MLFTRATLMLHYLAFVCVLSLGCSGLLFIYLFVYLFIFLLIIRIVRKVHKST